LFFLQTRVLAAGKETTVVPWGQLPKELAERETTAKPPPVVPMGPPPDIPVVVRCAASSASGGDSAATGFGGAAAGPSLMSYTGEITRVRGWGEWELDGEFRLVTSPVHSTEELQHLAEGALITVRGGHGLRGAGGKLVGIGCCCYTSITLERPSFKRRRALPSTHGQNGWFTLTHHYTLQETLWLRELSASVLLKFKGKRAENTASAPPRIALQSPCYKGSRIEGYTSIYGNNRTTEPLL